MTKGGPLMEDAAIIQLYFDRNQEATREDVEESVKN